MIEFIYMIVAFFTGILLGFFFFGGLWYTTSKSMTAKYPALWILGSFVLRTATILIGFYFVANGDWKRLVICLFGFIIARFATNRFVSFDQKAAKQNSPNEA